MRNSVKFSPIVIGIPRTGFSLLIAILNNLYYLSPNKINIRNTLYRSFSQIFGLQVSNSILKVFDDYNLTDSIYYNDNFRNMLGGPIWNNDELGTKAYFRKYIGAGSLGDFTLITSHPLEVLDSYEVVHSHGPFNDWIDNKIFRDYSKFASIRNPVATLNSACHSINALASEYIQKNMPLSNIETIRRDLAYYKLTDLNFFDSLLSPMIRSYQDLIECYDDYYVVPWEEIITTPVETIRKIANDFSLPVKESDCNAIWQSIGFRNLTGAHKHNYRVGKAYIGDELESITNEHIEIMKSRGVDKICKFFGYSELSYMDESKYTNFQRKCSAVLKKGEVLDPTEDRTLFNYAFNKSNIDFENFDFRMHNWKKHSRIERSTIDSSSLELSVSNVVEDKLEVINELLTLLITSEQTDKKIPDVFIEKILKQSAHFPDINIHTALSRMRAEISWKKQYYKKYKRMFKRSRDFFY